MGAEIAEHDGVAVSGRAHTRQVAMMPAAPVTL